jgi:hypothetical protein
MATGAGKSRVGIMVKARMRQPIESGVRRRNIG